MKPAPDAPPPPGHPSGLPSGPCPWLKRLGLAGFTFFLVKGLLWLTLPALLAVLGVGC